MRLTIKELETFGAIYSKQAVLRRVRGRHSHQRVLCAGGAGCLDPVHGRPRQPGHCPHLHQEDKQRGMLLQHLLLKVTIFPCKVLQDPQHLQFTQRVNVKRSADCNNQNHIMADPLQIE